MNPMVMLMLAHTAQAGGWQANTGLGLNAFQGDLKGVVFPGPQLELAAARMMGPLAIGATVRRAQMNGCSYEEQVEGCADAGGPGPFIQGDLFLQSYGLMVGLPALVDQPSWSLGTELVAGVARAPLLMDEAYYAQEVVAETWGGQDGGYHASPHPMATLGVVAATPLASIDGISPEVYLKVEGGYFIGLDVMTTTSIGIRVRTGGD